MRSGTVKWFNKTKGYGFITPHDRSVDVFVFYPSILQEGYKLLITGQKVKFRAVHSAFGPKTTEVLVDATHA